MVVQPSLLYMNVCFPKEGKIQRQDSHNIVTNIHISIFD